MQNLTRNAQHTLEFPRSRSRVDIIYRIGCSSNVVHSYKFQTRSVASQIPTSVLFCKSVKINCNSVRNITIYSKKEKKISWKFLHFFQINFLSFVKTSTHGRVIFAEESDTMSKTNVRRITLGITPIPKIHFITSSSLAERLQKRGKD